MKAKKGMSQIVTTIILVLLIIIAIVGIWAVVNAFIIKGSSSINLDKFTINLRMKKASINYTTGIAEVSVFRNSGEGNLTSIKFIVEDKQNSYVFEEDASTLYELGTRTYTLDLTKADYLSLKDIYKISIAPVFYASGANQLGKVSDSIGDLNVGVNSTMDEIGGGETGGAVCNRDSDCGDDGWVDGSEFCSDDNSAVMMYMKEYSCIGGFCDTDSYSDIFKTCVDGYCYDGKCIQEALPCSIETVVDDCGASDWNGAPRCSQDERNIVRDWQEFSCIDSGCVSSVEERVISECLDDEVCKNGECFVPLECESHNDCDPGEVCKNGECVLENYVSAGVLRSVWPSGVAEYADSEDFPINKSQSFVGYYIVFPGSLQTSCLRIADYVAPAFEEGISYIRFAISPTNVSDGDSYEIWETDYICSTL